MLAWQQGRAGEDFLSDQFQRNTVVPFLSNGVFYRFYCISLKLVWEEVSLRPSSLLCTHFPFSFLSDQFQRNAVEPVENSWISRQRVQSNVLLLFHIKQFEKSGSALHVVRRDDNRGPKKTTPAEDAQRDRRHHQHINRANCRNEVGSWLGLGILNEKQILRKQRCILGK